MKQEIKVPAMGESITEATIGAIIKKTGSSVSMDDELLELETDKVNQVIYAPQSGIFTLNVKEDETVKIGQVIGYIDTAASATDKKPPKTEEKAPPKTKEPAKAVKDDVPKPSVVQPQPSAKGARLTAEDFLAEIFEEEKPAPAVAIKTEAKALAPAPREIKAAPGERETRRKMSKIRKVIAQRLVEAQQTTAMLTTFNEVDLTQVIALREKYKESFVKEHGVKLGFMSFFVKACVSALMAIPDINSYLDGDDIVHREYYDIGIAVGTERGLIVPVVRDCDKLDFAGIEKSIETFAKKAREGTITADDLQGGGFTITNGGIYGSMLSTPILNPPQCAILGMHKIMKRPVVVDDQIAIRQMMYLALSYDHRIIDGKQAVTFLVHLKDCLEDPARLLLNL